eukprot:CAMPEP_0172631032 /NCGR_PEP_ID=MMETSP1068-20121228/176867_1 /TAXON_ID=35684 /ORGANISM="Pseudopedinella elastica, Strain CCMP716" /LENGTH=96 /DNA_ID=CAMNT_0013442043 /DNA_START=65 /DNA_END=352 /DNA_ORIENTATION=-
MIESGLRLALSWLCLGLVIGQMMLAEDDVPMASAVQSEAHHIPSLATNRPTQQPSPVPPKAIGSENGPTGLMPLLLNGEASAASLPPTTPSPSLQP